MSKAKCAQGGISIGMEELQSFQKYLEPEEKERATVQKYMRDVRSFLDFAGGSPVTKERVIAYKAWLAEQYAPRSANSMLVALNGFLRYLGADGCCVKLFRLQYQTFCERKRVLTQEEYKRLLDAARRKRQTRLYLILLTLCSTGIRISELKHITVEAIRQGSAVARNKGKSRVVLLPRRLCELLNGYVRWRGIESGPVFLTRGGKPVDRSNVWRSMQRLCREAGVSKAKAHPHSLRHLFACTFYESPNSFMCSRPRRGREQQEKFLNLGTQNRIGDFQLGVRSFGVRRSRTISIRRPRRHINSPCLIPNRRRHLFLDRSLSGVYDTYTPIGISKNSLCVQAPTGAGYAG